MEALEEDLYDEFFPRIRSKKIDEPKEEKKTEKKSAFNFSLNEKKAQPYGITVAKKKKRVAFTIKLLV